VTCSTVSVVTIFYAKKRIEIDFLIDLTTPFPPNSVKILSNDVNKLKSSLRKFLYVGSFYSLGEYFEWKLRDDLKSYK
jgi:hypothetical protein